MHCCNPFKIRYFLKDFLDIEESYNINLKKKVVKKCKGLYALYCCASRLRL